MKTRMSAVWVALLGVAACGAEGMAESAASAKPGETVMPGAACGLLNETRGCSCDEHEKGAQDCNEEGWSECICESSGAGDPEKKPSRGESAPAGNLRSDIEFEWERTKASQGSCEPGYYEGTFKGLYASSITVVGAHIPVFALGTPGKPGLSFTLKRKPGAGETLEIENGVMDGVADGAFPFKGTLTGTLDCDTLQFDAILDGYYSLGVDGVGMFKFKGPLKAGYDKATRSVTMGTWDVKEYDPTHPFPWVGGFGDWEAKWVR